MTAAILQGVPATTLDADLWIDLPERQYLRVLNLCTKLGARIIANTVVALQDDTLVNFLYRVDGVASFATESRRAVVIDWLGLKVKVLPLAKVIQSKEFVGRPKDIAQSASSARRAEIDHASALIGREVVVLGGDVGRGLRFCWPRDSARHAA